MCTKLMRFMSFTSNYTFITIGICAGGVVVSMQFVYKAK